MVRLDPGKREILVVGVEELFYELIQSFQSDRYSISYMDRDADVARHLTEELPDLLVLAIAEIRSAPPAWLAEARAAEVPVLGVTEGPPAPEDEVSTVLVDRVVGLHDRPAALDATLEMLGERRQRPRVSAEMDVTFEGGESGVVKDLSATSLQVETASPPAEGDRVRCTIVWGREPVTFEAEVYRVLQDIPARVVLRLDENDPARLTLDRIVRRMLEVGHYREASDDVTRRGPVAWQVARRAEQAFRQTRELQAACPPEADGEGASSGVVSRYHVGSRRGRWGVGEIHVGVERIRGTTVCLKQLREPLRSSLPARARMEMEARIASDLADLPGVAGVRDFGSDGQGGLYYAMENLEGVTLAEAAAGGQRFGARETARIGTWIADTLVMAEERGYGHHDLCPENVVLHRAGSGTVRPMLIGFASDLPHAPASETFARGAEYWPPEAPDVPLNPAHDAYALCALLREVYPEKDVSGDSRADEARRRLQRTLRRGTASAPSDRYWELTELARDLRRCSDALDAAIAGPPALVESPEDTPPWMPAEEAEMVFGSTAEPEPAAAWKDDSALRRSRRVVTGGAAAAASIALLLAIWQPWAPHRATPQSSYTPRTHATTMKARPVALGPERRTVAVPTAMPAPHREVAPEPAAEPSSTTSAAPSQTTSPASAATTAAASKAAPSAKKTRLSRYQRFRSYVRLGRYLHAHGHTLQARRYLTRALRYGDSAAARRLLAKTYIEAGKPLAALDHQRRAAQLAPQSWRYRLQLGRLYLDVGKRAQACKAFRAALARNPSHPFLNRHVQSNCGPVRTAGLYR